jgi:hypothetical protein
LLVHERLGLQTDRSHPKLSHHSREGLLNWTPSSSRRDSTQITSAVALDIALYSTSVLDRDTVACFLALHEIRLLPMNRSRGVQELTNLIH